MPLRCMMALCGVTAGELSETLWKLFERKQDMSCTVKLFFQIKLDFLLDTVILQILFLMMYLFTTVPRPHGHWQLQELLGNQCDHYHYLRLAYLVILKINMIRSDLSNISPVKGLLVMSAIGKSRLPAIAQRGVNGKPAQSLPKTFCWVSKNKSYVCNFRNSTSTLQVSCNFGNVRIYRSANPEN